jgi:hypothetical protein
MRNNKTIINEEKYIFDLDRIIDSFIDKLYNDIQNNINKKSVIFEYSNVYYTDKLPIEKLIFEVNIKDANYFQINGEYNTDKTQLINNKLNIIIGLDVEFKKTTKKNFIEILHGVIIHELGHAYKYYHKMTKNLKDDKGDFEAEVADLNTKKFSKLKYEAWDWFLHNFYASNTDEFSPTTIELFKKLDRKRIEKLKRNSRVFIIINNLAEYDGEYIYTLLYEEIENEGRKDPDIIISKLISDFNKNIEKSKKYFPDINTKEYSKAYKKNNLDFFSYYQKRFNTVGEKLKRQVYKILSLKY